MCAPSAPPPPDYLGAAREQGAANVEAARTQGRINNPNVNNPYGSQTVTWDGDTPTLTQTLSPQEQAVYDANVRNRLGLGGVAGQGIGSLQGLIGSQFNFDNTPERATPISSNAMEPHVQDQGLLSAAPTAYKPPTNLPNMPQSAEAIRNRVIQAQMARVNQDFANRGDQINSDLIARGIRPGTKAYETERQALERSRNDAYNQAEQSGGLEAARAYGEDLSTRQQAQNEALANAGLSFNQGLGLRQQGLQEQAQRFGQEGSLAELDSRLQNQYFNQENQNRQQAIAELLARRQTPLNEITALMSGSQVSNPFSVPGYAQNTSVAPPPLFGATQAAGQYAQNAYNQQVGSSNNALSGLFGIGSAFAGSRYLPMLFG